jgi:hypothetical protein
VTRPSLVHINETMADSDEQNQATRRGRVANSIRNNAQEVL